MIGNRTLRVGQYVQAGTQLMAVVPTQAAYIVANYKETQLTDVHAGQPVEIEVDTFPGQVFQRPCRQPRAGQRPGIRAAAARQRHRQLHQGRAAHPGEDRARSEQPARGRAAARHVGLPDHRHARPTRPGSPRRPNATAEPGRTQRRRGAMSTTTPGRIRSARPSGPLRRRPRAPASPPGSPSSPA